MPTIPSIHASPEQARDRLSSLGLTEEPLLHAAQRWYLRSTEFTPNHPPFGVGISAWTEAVAALRDGLLPIGWSRSDEKNYSLAVHPDGGMAINVATGDAGTGDPTADVSNRARKGSSTADAISVNQVQLEMDLPVPDMAHLRSDDGPLTWFLLLYRAENEVRAELSLPLDLSPDGRITRWQERIMLPSLPLDDPGATPEMSAGPDFDIPIKRRA